MKIPLTTLCLTFAVLLGSMGESASADFQKGLDAYKKGDFSKAAKEWRPLAEGGDAEAQYNLGIMYLLGEGISRKDVVRMPDLATDWIRKASTKNHPDALGLVASFYERGKFGFNKDLKKAVKLRTRAAETGDGLAIYNLSQVFLNGWGVEQNYDKAMSLLKNAASKNIQLAMYNLGVMHLKSEKYKNLKASYMWFDLTTKWIPDSQVTGNLESLLEVLKNAENVKTRLEKVLTPVELQNAIQLARECVRKNYKGC